jgi:uncharacterized small protein (DUF1192 family)
MLNKGKIKFLEDMIKSLAISINDLTSKVELLREEVDKIKMEKLKKDEKPEKNNA